MFVHALPTLPEHVRNRQTVVSVGSWASGTSWWFWDGNFTLKILQSSINPLVPNTTVPSTYLWFHVKEKYSFILIKPSNASSAGLTENVEQPWIAHGSAWKWSDHNITFDMSHEPEDTKQMTPPRDNKGSECRASSGFRSRHGLRSISSQSTSSLGFPGNTLPSVVLLPDWLFLVSSSGPTDKCWPSSSSLNTVSLNGSLHRCEWHLRTNDSQVQLSLLSFGLMAHFLLPRSICISNGLCQLWILSQ